MEQGDLLAQLRDILTGLPMSLRDALRPVTPNGDDDGDQSQYASIFDPVRRAGVSLADVFGKLGIQVKRVTDLFAKVNLASPSSPSSSGKKEANPVSSLKDVLRGWFPHANGHQGRLFDIVRPGDEVGKLRSILAGMAASSGHVASVIRQKGNHPVHQAFNNFIKNVKASVTDWHQGAAKTAVQAAQAVQNASKAHAQAIAPLMGQAVPGGPGAAGRAMGAVPIGPGRAMFGNRMPKPPVPPAPPTPFAGAGFLGAGASIALGAASTIGAIAAATVAFVGAAKALGQNVVDSNRKYAFMSGPLQVAYMSYDMGEYHRKMSYARNVGPSAANAISSYNNLKNSLQPIKEYFATFTNNLSALMSDLAAFAINNKLTRFLAKPFDWLGQAGNWFMKQLGYDPKEIAKEQLADAEKADQPWRDFVVRAQRQNTLRPPRPLEPWVAP